MAVNHNDILRVTVNISLPDNVVAQNVFYYRLDDPSPANPSNAQIITALEGGLEDIYETVEAYIVNDATVMDADVERIEWETDHWETKENVGIADIALVGDNVSDMLPHGVAAVVTANTNRPQTRARKFIPGINDTGYVDSDAISGLITALTNFAIQWLTGWLAADPNAFLIPTVVGMAGASAGNWYDLASAVYNTLAGYQRRRKPGVGS